jgi:N-methylhydantoinase A
MSETSAAPGLDGHVRVGVDIGGTFTDVAVADASGMRLLGKRLTVHGDEREGVLAAVADTNVDMTQVAVLAHGTTLVINALVERRGSTVALVATAGFRDIHQMGRQSRPVGLDPFYRRDPPLVPRHLSFELNERVLANGDVEVVPSVAEITALADELRGLGVDAVAVAFLNSYANPANEEFTANTLRSLLPDAFITTSSSLSRLWREYERFTTAAANAYVGKPIAAYLSNLAAGFTEQGFGGRFVLLDSNGGALPQEVAQTYPIRLVESGPVGGVMAARDLAAELELDRVVTFDMGGTTAKSCLIEGSSSPSVDVYWIGGYDFGFPIQVPTIDIIEVGSGGGSIAWVDEGGRLRVGPRSAGADPGPACYGQGGIEPTVTDAHVYCGHLSSRFFRARISIDERLAGAAIERLADRLQMQPMRLALGIVRLANLSMANLIRRQTIERGRDPRDFSIVAFGGAGPLHACEVAREADIRRVIVPPSPGHFSAVGMLGTNLRFNRRQTLRVPLADLHPEQLSDALQKTRAEVIKVAGLRDDDARNLRESYGLSMRYIGQEHTILVPQPSDGLTVPSDAAAHFRALFEDEYELRFGHLDELSEAEVVDVEVVVEEPLPRAGVPLPPATVDDDSGVLEACFGESTEAVQTRFVPRSILRVSEVVKGPAIVYEEGTNTVVPPGWTGTVTTGMHLNLTFDNS